MSTLKTNAILDASGGTTATVNGYTPTASNMAGRNRIIGGDFTTNPWQRGTSFAAIANGSYFADRWSIGYTTTAVVTASKATDAPTANEAGIFTQYCASLAVTTADTSIAASDRFVLRHIVEGLNAASFGFGQAGSRNVTLSFWVKGTKTGVHCVGIRNSADDRAYVAEYTIVTTNTWEYKTLTIPVDTTGTWLYDTGVGLFLQFALMAGTTYQTTANTWTAGSFFATANQVNALDAISNTFKIALVQLEAGSTATDFEYRPYGTELALCQRYFQNGHVYCLAYSSTGSGFGDRAPFPTVMRATPSITYSNTVYLNASGITTNEVDIYGVSPQVATTTTSATRYISDFAAAAEL